MVGSNYLLGIVIGGLDKQLDKRKWEMTVVYGGSANTEDPKAVDHSSDVALKGYRHFQFSFSEKHPLESRLFRQVRFTGGNSQQRTFSNPVIRAVHLYGDMPRYVPIDCRYIK